MLSGNQTPLDPSVRFKSCKGSLETICSFEIKGVITAVKKGPGLLASLGLYDDDDDDRHMIMVTNTCSLSSEIHSRCLQGTGIQ